MKAPSPAYRDTIKLVVLEKFTRAAQERIRRFERAHDEWRKLVGLPPIQR